MSPRPFKLACAFVTAAALAAGACSSFTGTAGESPFAFEQVGGATYLLSHEKFVADGTGEKDRWRLQKIGPRSGEPVFFDAVYSLDRPAAVGGISDADGSVAAWVAARYPGHLYRVERLGADGSRAAWDLPARTALPDAYRLLVTQPADASFTWVYFDQANDATATDSDGPVLTAGGPLLHIDTDGARVAADHVIWSRCAGECRYLVDDDGVFTLKNAAGDVLASWNDNLPSYVRAVCGRELVTEAWRYAIGATEVVATAMPRGFLKELAWGHLVCRDDALDWMWLETAYHSGGPPAAYAVDATKPTTRRLFTFPAGMRTAFAVLFDGRAQTAFDRYRDGTEGDSTERLSCDNDRPWAEPCAADYIFFSTAVSASTLHTRR